MTYGLGVPGPKLNARIGSITKTFTAIAVLQLSEQGLVDLDAPANDYLRAYRLIPAKAAHRPATVRQLLTHTAGLPQLVHPWRAFTPILGETVKIGRRLPSLAEFYRGGLRLVAEPGTRSTYSNHGFATLGQLVEDVSAVQWENLTADGNAPRQQLGFDKWAVPGHSFRLSHLVLLDTGGDSRWSQQHAADLLARRGSSPEKVELVRRWFNGEFTPREYFRIFMRIGDAYCYQPGILLLARALIEGGWRSRMRLEALIFAGVPAGEAPASGR